MGWSHFFLPYTTCLFQFLGLHRVTFTYMYILCNPSASTSMATVSEFLIFPNSLHSPSWTPLSLSSLRTLHTHCSTVSLSPAPYTLHDLLGTVELLAHFNPLYKSMRHTTRASTSASLLPAPHVSAFEIAMFVWIYINLLCLFFQR